MATPDLVIADSVKDGEADFFGLDVRPRVKEMDLILAWENDWSRFPTHDLDLIVVHFDRKGDIDFVSIQGATLDSPERAKINDLPKGGAWLLIVDGFTVFLGEDEPYTLWVFFK